MVLLDITSCLVIYCLLTYITDIGEARGPRVARVIGGQKIKRGESPWLVSLQAKIVRTRFLGIPVKYNYMYCGGSVLNDRWILTAAHCFDDSIDPNNWEARLATVSFKSDIIDRIKHVLGRLFGRSDWLEWEIDVDGIVIHPLYDKKNFWNNDIALVHLGESVPSGRYYSNIQRIRLPNNGDSFMKEGNMCVMKGWGCTEAGGSASSHAMKVNLPLLQEYRCSKYYGYTHLGQRVCAGFRDSNAGVCSGDSGGPLVCQDSFGMWTQVGVSSFGSKLQPGDFPGVFTRVYEYIDWINSVMGQ